METFETIQSILVDNLDLDPDSITGESTFESLNIDSLDMVQLICDLEERCDIDLGEPEGITTIDELVAYIETL